jgi:hypothetical protein
MKIIVFKAKPKTLQKFYNKLVKLGAKKNDLYLFNRLDPEWHKFVVLWHDGEVGLYNHLSLSGIATRFRASKFDQAIKFAKHNILS